MPTSPMRTPGSSRRSPATLPALSFPPSTAPTGRTGRSRRGRVVRGGRSGGGGGVACVSASERPVAKAIARAAGLATPASVTLPKETFHDLGAAAVLERIVATLGLPLFVKPARGGSA